jgi:hypothetical protein
VAQFALLESQLLQFPLPLFMLCHCVHVKVVEAPQLTKADFPQRFENIRLSEQSLQSAEVGLCRLTGSLHCSLSHFSGILVEGGELVLLLLELQTLVLHTI